MATDPALLAQYTSGQISYTQYSAAVKAQEQAAKTAYTISMLQNMQGVSSTLIASEIALQQASLARAQQQAARDAAARQQQAAANTALQAQQAAVDAARRNKDAAAAAAAAAELRRQQIAAADARAAATRAEQARRQAEEQRTSQLIEEARQKMIAETGRVVAPEQEGAVIAAAMAKATAETDLAMGNYNGVSVYLANQPGPTYIPDAAMRNPQPPPDSPQKTPVYYPTPDSPQKTPVYYPSLPTPPTDYVPVSATAVYNPSAYTPTVATDLPPAPPSWYESSNSGYAPVTSQPQTEPAANPYLYMTDQQKAAQDLGKKVGLSLLVGALGLLLAGVWIQT